MILTIFMYLNQMASKFCLIQIVPSTDLFTAFHSISVFALLLVNRFPDKLAPNVPINLLRNPPFCYFLSFWIVSLPSFFSKTEFSEDLTIFIKSSISYFEIAHVVMSCLIHKFCFEQLHQLRMLLLLILTVLNAFM